MREEFELVIADDEVVAGALVASNHLPVDIAKGLQEFGIETDLTAEELFDVATQAFSTSLFQAVKAGVAYMAAQQALKITDCNTVVVAGSKKTFISWIEAKKLTEARVYEVIRIAKGYLAIPVAQRKSYLALGKYKAIKLASIEPEALAELADKNPEALDEMALMSRSELAKRIANLSAQLEMEQAKTKRLTEVSRSTRLNIQLEGRTEDVRAECMALQLGAELHLNSLRKLFEETDAQAPEGTLQVEHLWVVANTLAARTADLLEFMAARVPEGMPERPMSRHLLSPEEAQRWLFDYPLIENRFAAEAAVRESRRDMARPRGPGRPVGSRNKGDEA